MAWIAHNIVQNGKAIPFGEARVHPLSVGLAYGAAVFEGIRAYMNTATRRLSVFRLEEHLARLDQGMKFMRFDDPPSRGVLRQGVLDSIRTQRAGRRLLHPAPGAYREPGQARRRRQGRLGLRRHAPRAQRKRETGLACCVSSGRVSPTTPCRRASNPPRNYHAGRIATMQAKADGYDMPILLTREGKLSETAGACLCLIRDGVLITPTRDSDILEKRDAGHGAELAAENGIPVQERRADRTELYIADEVFLCGTGRNCSRSRRTTACRWPTARPANHDAVAGGL